MHLVSMQVPHKRKSIQVPPRRYLKMSYERWLRQYLKHCLARSIFQTLCGNSAFYVIIVHRKLLRMLEGELAFSKTNLILTCCTSVHIMHYQDFLMLPRKKIMLNMKFFILIQRMKVRGIPRMDQYGFWLFIFSDGYLRNLGSDPQRLRYMLISMYNSCLQIIAAFGPWHSCFSTESAL